MTGVPLPFATSSDGARIFSTTMGQGTPLVLLHGTTHSWESWQDLGYIDGLKDHFQLILIDARGHGQSDKPHAVSAYAMAQQADDVMAVVDSLGIGCFHLFGYSLGAMTGFHLAAREPERVQSLISYGGDPYPPNSRYKTSIADDIAILREGVPAWVDLMERLGVFDQYPEPAARKQRLLAVDPDALIASILASVENPGVGDALEHLTMPCLVIAGQLAGGNEPARQAAAELPVADFVSITGIGHAMVNAQIILPYVRAFYERFGVTAAANESA